MKGKQEAKINQFMLILLLLGIASCDTPTNPAEVEKVLPFLGEHEVEFNKMDDGTMVADTVYYTIPKFSFINQDGRVISHRDYDGKIFVADFFFTHCPSICPMMSAQMMRLQGKVKDAGLNEEVMFLSHTVDPTRDTPDTLKAYSQKIGADLSNWNFVTGPEEDIYYQAENGYMLTAFPSDSADGGFFHSDKIALIDRQRRLRGIYDGTSTKSVDQLFEDLKVLKNEK